MSTLQINLVSIKNGKNAVNSNYKKQGHVVVREKGPTFRS